MCDYNWSRFRSTVCCLLPLKISIFDQSQGCPNLFLQIDVPAKFSSTPNQTHLHEIKPLETLGYITDGHVGAGLALNSTGALFADNTTLISLIQEGDESASVKELAVWCSLKYLELNTLKTVEMIMDFRRNQKNQTQEQFLPSSHHQTIIPGITIFSFHCHLASASGAWWQKLRRREEEELLPSGHQAPKLKLSLITFTGLNLINCKTFIILHHPHCCYVYIPATTCLHIPLAHPCLYYLLSPQYTVLHILFHYTLHSFFLLIWTYIYIYSLCFIFLHCPLSGPVLIYISLLIISCIIEYVTNKRTLNLMNTWQ